MLKRIYAREPHGVLADTFRHFGPLYRFDHQRHPIDNPAHDEERGVLYVSKSTECCFLEVFFDRGVVSWDNGHGVYRLATLRVTKLMKLLKLDGENDAIDAGTTQNIFTEPHAETQPWARHFYERTDVYGSADGISYRASHGGQVAVLLFERAKDKVEVLDDLPFTDPVASNVITQLTHRYRLQRDGF